MKWLWAAGTLVLAADAWLLAGVARNRRAGPEYRFELRPGDYHMVRYGEENSGVAIRLNIAPPRVSYRLSTRAPRRVPGKPAFAILERRTDAAGLSIVQTAEDAAALRRRFPDAARFPLVRAVVRPWGYQALNPTVHVPLPYSQTLLAPGEHSVTLCFGRNHEPWICGVR